MIEEIWLEVKLLKRIELQSTPVPDTDEVIGDIGGTERGSSRIPTHITLLLFF